MARRAKKNTSPRPVLWLVLLAAMIGLLTWTRPGAEAHSTLQATPTPTAEVSPTPPRFPEEYTDPNQTNGIVLGASVLVLIVLIGTLTVIRYGRAVPPPAPAEPPENGGPAQAEGTPPSPDAPPSPPDEAENPPPAG